MMRAITCLGHPGKVVEAVHGYGGTVLEYSLPAAFPATTQYAARAFYLLQAQAPGAAEPFAHAALRGFFAKGQDITNIEVVARKTSEQTEALGPPAAVREQLQSPAAKALLQEAVAAAVERNVFGSPYVVVDDGH